MIPEWHVMEENEMILAHVFWGGIWSTLALCTEGKIVSYCTAFSKEPPVPWNDSAERNF